MADRYSLVNMLCEKHSPGKKGNVPPTSATNPSAAPIIQYCLMVRSINDLTRGVRKVCNSIWCTNDTSKIFMLLFNIITHNTNAYVTFIKKLFYASQIELWWPAVQIRLSTQWPVWSHCHRGTTSSDDKIDQRHWVLGLLSRVGVTTIPIQCSLLQPAEQEQGSKMMRISSRPLSRTWRACNKNSIWLASKSI